MGTTSRLIMIKEKVQISPDNNATNSPYIHRNRGQKFEKYTYAFKLVKVKREKKPTQIETYLKNSKSRKIYTRDIIIRQREIERSEQRIYEKGRKKIQIH